MTIKTYSKDLPSIYFKLTKTKQQKSTQTFACHLKPFKSSMQYVLTVDPIKGLVWKAHPKLLPFPTPSKKVKTSLKICIKLPNLGLGGVSMPGGTISAHHGRRVSPTAISGGSCALEEVWNKGLSYLVCLSFHLQVSLPNHSNPGWSSALVLNHAN